MSNDPTRVDSWLENLGMEQYAPAFRTNHVTWELLPTLSDADLRDCGVDSLGHRRTLLQALRTLPGETPAPVRPPARTENARPAGARGMTPPPNIGNVPTPTLTVTPAATVTPSAGIAPTENVAAPLAAVPTPTRARRVRVTASRALVVTILLHVLFGVGATYLVVQHIQAKRKLTFQGGPPTPNPSTRALEHKMNMARRQQTMSAPAQAKRITTTGLSKVSLPDMPSMPSMSNDIVPGRMAGQGGVGVGFGPAGGMSGGIGGAGGGSVPLFGAHRVGGGSLVGTFYDLKQDRSGHPTNMAIVDQNYESKAEDPANFAYFNALSQFCRNAWNDSNLDKFFKGPQSLYATQMFVPVIQADEGPKSFDLADKVKPRRWVIHYKGKVSPPVDGKFRFVGFGDDVLTVKFAGRVVFDVGFLRPSGAPPPKDVFAYDGLILDPKIGYGGCGAGEWFDVRAGNTYPMELITGECPGGFFRSYLLLQKDGAEYDKDSKGSPKFPIFKLAASGPPQATGEQPVIGKDTPWSIWKAEPQTNTSGSIFGGDL